ncbi:elongation factor P-like protein YeiP [Endozoicomonas sp. OPT23]|uniref:elongation factor P-like protein EfpL n=1 Tax=Endozoicomonas sp. OPT23 TaxID=2072845 RepID=UPI00129A4C22|nr:elongation factor P-like protein YeiP [Endozoicomonas sp. OPT23]MRI34075.1 elongation factor P-like protein YeiP [Endozoicomonas sp. OPT23]
MAYAKDLKKGHIVQIENNYYIVRTQDTKSPSARGASTLYKFRFSSVPGGQKLEMTCTGDDQFTDVDLQRRNVSLLYKEGDEYTFMDSEDYSQFLVNGSTIEEQLLYINDGMENLTAMLVEGQLLAIELPTSIALEIVDTSPAIKGASAAARTKPATLSTGLEVQVPEYLAIGEIIKVNTETGKFMSRA